MNVLVGAVSGTLTTVRMTMVGKVAAPDTKHRTEY
jgi:hypothetical protein